jgi:hypothetical protein
MSYRITRPFAERAIVYIADSSLTKSQLIYSSKINYKSYLAAFERSEYV